MYDGKLSFKSWVNDRVIKNSVLAQPLRFFWIDYQEYCRAFGFTAVSPILFVEWLRKESDLTIVEKGSGHIGRVVKGAATKRGL